MAVKRSPFFAPAPLLAVAVLAVNDHALKDRFHNAVTGKLTDLALCFFFPLLLSVLLRPLIRGDRARMTSTAIVTALLYTVLELWAPAGDWLTAAVAVVGRPLGFGLTPFTRDPTDLLALAMVPLAWSYGVRRLEGPPAARPAPWLLRASALAGTLVFLVAESPPADCDHRSAAITFRVSGECGAPGIIVIHSDNYDSDLTAHNGDAVLGASRGKYQGAHCPFRLDLGSWYLETDRCRAGPRDAGESDGNAADAGDAGAADAGDAAAGADAGAADGGTPGPRFDAAPPTCGPERRCTATEEGGALWISCQEGTAAPTCKARLTVVEGP